MAKPEHSHADLVAFVHTSPVGTKANGFTLQARTERDGGHWYEVVVTKGPRTWTAVYLWHTGGGRVVKIVDELGRRWFPTPDKSDWIDGGTG